MDILLSALFEFVFLAPGYLVALCIYGHGRFERTGFFVVTASILFWVAAAAAALVVLAR